MGPFDTMRRLPKNDDMDNKNNTPFPGDSAPLSTSLTARMITVELGESEAVWLRRLHNWRRPDRTSPLPWQETEAGRPVYSFDAVRAFIDTQLKARAATAAPGTGPNATKASATVDTDGAASFVRVLWNAGNAQGAFSITSDMARALAARLLQSAAQADKTANSQVR